MKDGRKKKLRKSGMKITEVKFERGVGEKNGGYFLIEVFGIKFSRVY